MRRPVNRNVTRLMTSEIFLAGDRRPAVPEKVKALAESINEVGLQNPISVRFVDHHFDPNEGDLEGAYILVTGRHRLEAFKALGETHIECFVVEMDDLHAELAEIDENLIRCNLTPAQEAAAIARRKAIYEELHPETKQGANVGPQRQFVASDKPSFASNTADATGKDKRTVERAAARGEALGDDLNDIAGTSLDKGVELDALAKLPAGERKRIIDCAKAGENVSARVTKIDGDVKQRCDRANAERAVEHLPHEVLEAFISDLFAAGHKSLAIEIKNLIGQSIMDRRFA